MNDIFTCAWRELRRRKTRTLTNIFGYTLAVAMMIVLGSNLFNSKEKAGHLLNNTGTHFIAFLPDCITGCAPYKKDTSLKENEGFIASGISTNLIPISFINEVKNLPSVKDAAPFLLFQLRSPKDNQLFTIGGFNPNDTIAVGSTSCAPSDIVAGRFLTVKDSNIVIVEESYALLKNIKVNDRIEIAGALYPVKGIVNAGIRPAKANIYLIYADAEKIINKRLHKFPIHNQTNVLLVEAKNAQVQDSASKSIKTLFPSLTFSSYSCYKPAAEVMGLNETSVWSFIIIIGAATLILSMKSQLTSIIERRREIGILKSIGWSNRNVISQLLVESFLQAALGGLFGCLTALMYMLFVPVIISGEEMISFHDSILIWISIASFILSLVGGIIAGSLPAFLVARQQPADALRSL
ncbi:MAG: FtsX-like permease family protein [Ignavibacteriales bacterium]|nr:FtsX-like permease family protein [Ignavibacteriales bacterium]